MIKIEPVAVKMDDFADQDRLCKAVPYGEYDLAENTGFVNVSISADTTGFAVQFIRLWWQQMSQGLYPDTRQFYTTADAGGNNSPRGQLRKRELPRSSTENGLKIAVSHFPTGNSRWNKTEHRRPSNIAKNQRTKHLASVKVIVNLIANTTTKNGLKVQAWKEHNTCTKGMKMPGK